MIFSSSLPLFLFLFYFFSSTRIAPLENLSKGFMLAWQALFRLSSASSPWSCTRPSFCTPFVQGRLALDGWHLKGIFCLLVQITKIVIRTLGQRPRQQGFQHVWSGYSPNNPTKETSRCEGQGKEISYHVWLTGRGELAHLWGTDWALGLIRGRAGTGIYRPPHERTNQPLSEMGLPIRRGWRVRSERMMRAETFWSVPLFMYN